MMHRTHMGVDNGWISILLQAVRNALSDGWGGSMIATEVSDILYGTPKPVPTSANMGVLKEDHVNVIVHGHNPVVSEMILLAAQEKDILALAKSKGAKGINIAGLCCTGNELLMRHGVAIAGNHLMTELVVATGAVEMLFADYQCIMPSLGGIGSCYHTRMISTSDKARFPHMEHHEFHPHNAAELAKKLVREAVENFENRGEVYIPVDPVPAIGGFSVEAVVGALGGTPEPLIDAIKAGKIRGAAGVVGCNNPKIKHDYGHVKMMEKLIANDILVVDTGCAAVASAQGRLQDHRCSQAGRPRTSGGLRRTGNPARASFRKLRGQRAHLSTRRRSGQHPGHRHQRPAHRRSGPRMVFGKSRVHRRLLRGLRHLHRPRPHAPHHRQHERRETSHRRPGRRPRRHLRC